MKHYETELPTGYRESCTLDATKGRFALWMNLAAVLITAAVCALAALCLQPNFSMLLEAPLATLLRCGIFCGAMIAYIILHELVHGAAYKVLTHRRLTYGITFTCAYCGVPDIYVYRRAAMTALAAPFLLFIPIFLLPSLLLPLALDRFLAAILLGFHLGGCAGDLYGLSLYLFRFRAPTVLMRDTGPKQSFYEKEESDV